MKLWKKFLEEIFKRVKRMALETLEGIKEINGFKVIVMDHGNCFDSKTFEEEIRPNYPIQIRHDKNSISFTIQNGPVKEFGVNGCQVDSLIEAAKLIIEGLNKMFPCRENAMVITKLDEALMWSNKRKADREKRGVEGLSKE